MPDPEVQVIADRIRRHFEDACYVCGRSNPLGLHIDRFDRVEAGVTAQYEPDPHHRGAPGILHGGIAAALLDEIMAWTGVLTERVMSVTATMEIRYRKPAIISGGAFTLTGELVDRRGRRLSTRGSLQRDGVALAEATGVYVITHDLTDLLSTAI